MMGFSVFFHSPAFFPPSENVSLCVCFFLFFSFFSRAGLNWELHVKCVYSGIVGKAFQRCLYPKPSRTRRRRTP
uniref:Uncharacterized protein n=1 Tax=Anguilla anguilla TaxID=7936 RepID=A0A0E9X349_ANGAN